MSQNGKKTIRPWRYSSVILGASVLIIGQYILTFFVFNLGEGKLIQLSATLNTWLVSCSTWHLCC
jgi:hypothetical protein